MIEAHDRPMNAKESKKYFEVILGFVLGIVGIVLGSLLIAGSCNLIFSTAPNSPACQQSGSNVLGLVGIVLAPIGALAVVASIAVLRGRNHVSES
jgi:hypothetical protein